MKTLLSACICSIALTASADFNLPEKPAPLPKPAAQKNPLISEFTKEATADTLPRKVALGTIEHYNGDDYALITDSALSLSAKPDGTFALTQLAKPEKPEKRAPKGIHQLITLAVLQAENFEPADASYLLPNQARAPIDPDTPYLITGQLFSNTKTYKWQKQQHLIIVHLFDIKAGRIISSQKNAGGNLSEIITSSINDLSASLRQPKSETKLSQWKALYGDRPKQYTPAGFKGLIQPAKNIATPPPKKKQAETPKKVVQLDYLLAKATELSDTSVAEYNAFKKYVRASSTIWDYNVIYGDRASKTIALKLLTNKRGRPVIRCTRTADADDFCYSVVGLVKFDLKFSNWDSAQTFMYTFGGRALADPKNLSAAKSSASKLNKTAGGNQLITEALAEGAKSTAKAHTATASYFVPVFQSLQPAFANDPPEITNASIEEYIVVASDQFQGKDPKKQAACDKVLKASAFRPYSSEIDF